jgi:hypothetical protein
MSLDVPDACTLPTAEQPLRLAEFDELFATAVRRVDTVSTTHEQHSVSGAARPVRRRPRQQIGPARRRAVPMLLVR